MESNFYFRFEKSEIAKAVRIEKNLIFKWRKVWKKIFLVTFVVSLVLFFIFSEKKFLAFSSFSLSFFIFFFLIDLFFEKKLKNPKPKGDFFDLIDFQMAKAIYNCFSKFKKINNSLFLHALLDEKDFKINFIFSRLFIPLNRFKSLLSVDQEESEEEVEKLILDISKGRQEKIKLGDLLFYLSQRNKIFQDFLIEYDLKSDDFKEVADWVNYLEKEFWQAKKFWEWENLLKNGSLAREWAAGYTVLLDQFSFDVTKAMKRQGFRKIFAHESGVKMIERILSSPEKNDVLIVGEAGSGRKSMIESLANNCALGKSLPELNFKRVVYLDLPRIISATETIEDAENILDSIFNEAAFAGNVILVIDNLHQYIAVETERKAGVIEISGILSSYVNLPNFYCIGITTYEGLHKNLEQKPTLLESFEKIEVKEVSEKETLAIIEDRALRLEAKYKVFFTFKALKNIIELCSKYIPAIPFPEKAIEVIDELAVMAAQRKEKIILPVDVSKIIERKTKIPVGEIKETERRKLLNLENLIHERIIDQEDAVKEISESLRRAKAEIKLRKGPIGCFLFLGPTGVGKTETAKALAEIYFGSEEKMIRLDMSEFQNLNDIPRLLGEKGEEGLLTTRVREKPFSLILLDEFEKAHPNILNLFLQVFDEGHLTDGMGRKVDFKNTIIIATSNAGYQIILQVMKELTAGTPFSSELLTEKPVGRKPEVWKIVKKRLLDFIFEKGIFRPELVNRFDAVVVFKPLTKENLLDIADLQLKKIKKQLAEKYIDFVITQPLKEKIVELSYDITFGARNMQRIIQEKIGNILAQAILSGQLRRGNKVEIDSEHFTLKINP